MPSASPIAVIMLTMKKDSEVNCPRTEEMATVTMMDKMAMLIGMNAATRAPKTRTSTIIAAGSPNFSSPFVRSDSESSVKSWSRVFTPVTSTSKSAAESAATTSSITSTIPFSGSCAEHQRHHRGVPVLRDAGLVGGVGVADGLGCAGGLDRGPDLRDERLELRVVAGEVGRVDDHGVVDPVGLGEVVGDHLLRP